MRTVSSIVFCIAATVGVSPSLAQEGFLIGTWVGTSPDTTTTTLVVDDDSHYRAQHVLGPRTTFDSGTYAVANDTISFHVTSWGPQASSEGGVDESGAPDKSAAKGAAAAPKSLAPAGGVFRFRRLSGDTVSLHDIASHVETIMRRIK